MTWIFNIFDFTWKPQWPLKASTLGTAFISNVGVADYFRSVYGWKVAMDTSPSPHPRLISKLPPSKLSAPFAFNQPMHQNVPNQDFQRGLAPQRRSATRTVPKEAVIAELHVRQYGQPGRAATHSPAHQPLPLKLNLRIYDRSLTRLHAKKKQLKLLMIMMLVFMFMVSAPLLGPRIFAKEFSHLKGAGLQFFYIATPAVFGALFLFDLFLYRRVEKKLRGGK